MCWLISVVYAGTRGVLGERGVTGTLPSELTEVTWLGAVLKLDRHEREECVGMLERLT